jgi:hypothetical protein
VSEDFGGASKKAEDWKENAEDQTEKCGTEK